MGSVNDVASGGGPDAAETSGPDLGRVRRVVAPPAQGQSSPGIISVSRQERATADPETPQREVQRQEVQKSESRSQSPRPSDLPHGRLSPRERWLMEERPPHWG